jgi:outer membrane lipoprotein SlyB
MEGSMMISRAIAFLTLGSVLALPLSSTGQETAAQRRHRRAVEAQRASDHQHHTGAKVVGGSAVGGAVVGGLMGGGKGALIGGALGAGGGVVANKAREHHDVKKREQRRETPR